MGKDRFIFLSIWFLMTLFAGTIYAKGQETVTITVSDTQGDRLPYPEVMAGPHFHRVGGADGTIEVPLSAFNLNDTLTIKYLGYQTAQILLDSIAVSKSVITAALEEEPYVLDGLVVRPSAYSSDEYFQKKKKNLLLPYYRRYFWDLEFTYDRNDLPGHTYRGSVSGMSRAYTTEMDSTGLTISEATPDSALILRAGKRATEISYLAAHIFCHKSERKNFYCLYLGKTDKSEVWEFTIRQQEKMPWNLKKDDLIRCMVSLDQEGIITNIKTQLTSSDSRGTSYWVNTEYGRYDNMLVPMLSKVDLIPNAHNEEIRAGKFTLKYSNIRREK